jgi:CxxC-x17-CxxC domain-containing protein
MNTYNNDRRGGFSKPRGGDRGGYGGGRPKFGGDRNGGGRGGDRGDRPMQLHKATCASCQKLCEVPFKPSGDKPVYCSDCFKKRDGGGRDFKGGDRGDRGERSFAPRNAGGPSSIRHEHPNDRKKKGMDDDLNKRLMTIESKLNRILDLINPPQPPVKKIRPVDEAREERKTVDAPALKAAVESVLVEIKDKKPVKKSAKPAAKKAAKKATPKKK